MLKQTREADDEATFEIGGATLSKADAIARIEGDVERARTAIVAMRDEWVRARAASGVEGRWRRAQALYDGGEAEDSPFVDTLKTGPAQRKAQQQQANRSKVVVNIVRPKVDQATARFCEILLPTDDQNWDVRPTAVPSGITAMQGDQRVTVMPNGQPNPEGLTADQEASEYIKAMKARAEAMRKAIDDKLTECDYNAQQRTVIADGVRLGTGVILGPFPGKQTSKVWTEGGLEYSEQTVPRSAAASPWDVWFDPAAGDDHQAGAGFWHRRTVTRKQIRAMSGVLGFDDEAIRRVLIEEPTRVLCAEGRVQKSSAVKEHAYEMWTYHGELEASDMEMVSQGTDDPLVDVDFGVLIMINDRIVGAMPSWIADRSLPVDVWCWRKDNESPYGHGLPLELEHQQRVVTAAWRQVMDNARFAVGSQIVLLDGIRPVDGSSTIYPGKLWAAEPAKVDDARKGMASIDFPSHLDDLLAIAKTAMELADMESSLPQILGGQQGSAPETVGGMVMLHNNAQAVLRLRVKLFDDCVTRPHISRYYDWHMLNDPDPSIKGDMEIDARGSSALLEKDIQNQATLNLAAITNNPKFAPFIDAKAEFKMLMKAFRQDPESIMASEDEIAKRMEAMQQQPPDPRIQAAQLVAQTRQAELQDRQQARQIEMQIAMADRQDRLANLQYQSAREQSEFQIATQHEQNLRDIELAKLAHEQKTSVTELQAKMGLETLKLDQQRQLANAEFAIKSRMGSGI